MIIIENNKSSKRKVKVFFMDNMIATQNQADNMPQETKQETIKTVSEVVDHTTKKPRLKPEEIQFDYNELTKDEKATYDKLTDPKAKEKYESYWVSIAKQKAKITAEKRRMNKAIRKIQTEQSTTERA